MEIWKPIHSLNDKYEASNDGEIRNTKTGRILKQFTNQFGYKIMTVRPELNIQKNAQVHRLVAEAFYGTCPEGCVVNHKDGDKTNNHPENLEYVTPSQNNQHALDTGLRNPADMAKYAPRGEQHYCAKIKESDVIEILRLRKETGLGCRRLAKITGIPHSTINGIIRGKSWKHITEKYQ